MKKIDYKSAGVDIDAGNHAVELITASVKSTFNKNVLTGIGSFGSLFNLKEIVKNYDNPVLVQSIDGVGTKTIIARKMQKFLHDRHRSSKRMLQRHHCYGRKTVNFFRLHC